MPVRGKKSPPKSTHTYEYEALLRHIRKHIDAEFGGVTAFLKSDSFVSCGFVDTKRERSKMSTYLSLPKAGELSRVKSYPVLKKLYKHLLGVNVNSKIIVSREQTLVTDTLIS